MFVANEMMAWGRFLSLRHVGHAGMYDDMCSVDGLMGGLGALGG